MWMINIPKLQVSVLEARNLLQRIPSEKMRWESKRRGDTLNIECIIRATKKWGKKARIKIEFKYIKIMSVAAVLTLFFIQIYSISRLM